MTAGLKYRHAAGLLLGFIGSMERVPSRPALHVDGNSLTYESLGHVAGHIAASIRAVDRESTPLVALLAHRSLTAYAGVLGILGAGKGYVPLNPKFPLDRLARILTLANTRIIVVGKETWTTLEKLLPMLPDTYLVLCPDMDDLGDPSPAFSRHRIISSPLASSAEASAPLSDSDLDSIAYLLFTSGSTGEPKGVPVRQGNVMPYVQYICGRYGVNESDRFSQMFDLSFDLSVHDMFVCWERGACVYVVPEYAVMAPSKFIRDHQITMWFSVPSVVGMMSKLGMLKSGCFPSLRGSLFCGEPLHSSYAAAWQDAAPYSFVENLYGPTETTIAITHYRWDKDKSAPACGNGIVPIGQPFAAQRACVVDAALRPVEISMSGELCLSGSQVTQGYWNNPEKTATQFVLLPTVGEQIWYRTGDLVKQDEQGCLHYLGRIDNQVQIRGHRVELQEIDFVLRKASGCQQVASVAWPVRQGIADGIVSFLCGAANLDMDQILRGCREALPDYMIPRTFHFLDDLPLNVHGKIDRLQLLRILEGIDETTQRRRTPTHHQTVDQTQSTTE